MAKPHVLLLPGPAQGHVIPAMELAQRLVNQGVKVTVIHTEVTYKAITTNWLEKADGFEDQMELVSIPDGLAPGDDRNEFGKLKDSMIKTMPSKIEELITMINEQESNRITCFIVDFWMAWALKVVEKTRIRKVTFFPASTATLAIIMNIPKLVDDGLITNTGVPRNNEMIQLIEGMPSLKPQNLIWACLHDSTVEDHFQHHLNVKEHAKMAEWCICNSAVELESAAFNLHPKLLPIGPLLASNRLADQVGHFWQQDSTCLAWLDQQPTCSVIYIAFGSITNINQTQFHELAHGLELTNKPFLWVVRPGLTKEGNPTYPDGFLDRVGSCGRIVSWAPQQKVLSHPSIACFMSHCGWNSTLEGVTNGIPFLCWPYFADQFYNETYICDFWKTGMRFKNDGAGIITREEIKFKIEQLLSDKTIKSNTLDIKKRVASTLVEGGCSHNNLIKFINWIHGNDAYTEGSSSHVNEKKKF